MTSNVEYACRTLTSTMKIQRQPFSPPSPSILAMPKASKPENAPPDAAEVYKSASRVCVSFGIYHLEMIKMAPGNRPASNRPRRKRTTTSSPKLWMTPVQVMMAPYPSSACDNNVRGKLRCAHPSKHAASQVPRRSRQMLHDHVARHLGQDVRDEEDGQCHVVLIAVHM